MKIASPGHCGRDGTRRGAPDLLLQGITACDAPGDQGVMACRRVQEA